MKNIIYFLIPLTFALISCASSKKQLSRGSYEAAFEKAIRKLSKNPFDNQELEVLASSYSIIKTMATHKIDQLLSVESSGALLEALYLYKQMQKYTDRISYLPNRVTERLTLEDYSENIITLSNNVSDLLFAEAEELLIRKHKLDAQLAHEKLESIRYINPHYPDLKNMLIQAAEIGTFNISVNLNDYFRLHPDYQFAQNFENDVYRTLNRNKWIRFDHLNSEQVDGQLALNIDFVGVRALPVVSHVETYNRKMEIVEYILDENGNVRKDSLGNDLKVIKYKNISARVVEEVYQYDLVLAGEIFMEALYGKGHPNIDPLDFLHSHQIYRYRISGNEEAIDIDLLEDIYRHNRKKQFEQQAWFESNKYRVQDYIRERLSESAEYFEQRYS